MRVPHLVVGGDQPLLLGEHARLLLGARDHAHDPLFELLLPDDLVTVASRQQRSLVDEVGEVGAGESGRLPGERAEVDLARDRLALGVHLEDLLAPVAIRPVDHDLAVEAARAQQRGVEDVGPVGGRDQDDVVLELEAVHLDQELVERLLALVVTATEAGAAMAADGVDLVHEDDARRVLLGLLEEVAHARGADADEHLDEVGAGDREERHAGLAGDRACEQRLAGARRPVQQHALGDARTERLELLGVLEELLDLVQLLDGLVGSRDVLERDLGRVDGHALGAALAEAHHLRAAALHLVYEEDPEAQEEDEGQRTEQQAEPLVAADAGELDAIAGDAVLDQRVDQVRGGVTGARVAGGELRAVLEHPADLDVALVELDRIDRARGLLVLRELHERAPARLLGGRAGAAEVEHALRHVDEHEHDQNRQGNSLERTVHVQILAETAPARQPGLLGAGESALAALRRA